MSVDWTSCTKYAKFAIGAETRGKTIQNRLRRVDNFILMYCPNLLINDEHCFVDLGFGCTPTTTLESAKRFRQYNNRLTIIGVEIDRKRVREAQRYVDDLTYFRHGGFNLPLKINPTTGRRETVSIVRAFNVLRQYESESDCHKAHAVMCDHLNSNGILIEGTSDPYGRIWVANVIRKQDENSFSIEALVFSTNFRDEFNIVSFQQVLPKNFIHRMTGSNEMIYNFFEDWKISYEQVGKSMERMYGIGIRQKFIITAKYLAEEYGYNILLHNKFLKNGFLVWQLNTESKGVDLEQVTFQSPIRNKK